MDLDFNAEQGILRKSAREFMKRNFPKTMVREMEEDPTGYRAQVWKGVVDLGWPAWIVPEQHGGVGGSFLDVVVLFEEMGRSCFISPLGSTIVGTLGVLESGNQKQKEEWLPRIARGEMILSLALTEEEASYDFSRIKTSALAGSDEYVVNGVKMFVQDAQVVTHFLCVAGVGRVSNPGDGISLLLIDAKSPGISVVPIPTMADDKQNRVVLEGVRVPAGNLLSQPGTAHGQANVILEKAAILKCAEMLGGADWVMEASTEYAKVRVQYGKPIGSFQAIQHYLADMWTQLNHARGLVYHAAWLLSEGKRCTREVAMAKVMMSDVYRFHTRQGVQVHGGIGTTRDHDMGLYYRRSLQSALMYGSPDFWRERLACELGL